MKPHKTWRGRNSSELQFCHCLCPYSGSPLFVYRQSLHKALYVLALRTPVTASVTDN